MDVIRKTTCLALVLAATRLQRRHHAPAAPRKVRVFPQRQTLVGHFPGMFFCVLFVS